MSAAAAADDSVTFVATGAGSPIGFRRLWHYARRSRRTYLIGLVALLGYVASFTAIPVLVGWAVSAISEGRPPRETVWRCAWIGVAALLRGGLRYVSRRELFNAGRQVEYELRNDVFAHLQRLPQSFYLRWRTGDLMSRCVNDLNSVRMLLGPGLLNIVQTPILYASVLGVMFYLDAKLALLVLVPYPLFILIARAFGRAMHQTSLRVQEGLSDLSNQLQESIAGVSVVKAYAMEPTAAARFEQRNQELYRRQLRFLRVNASMPAITGLLPALAMWVVMLVGGSAITRGEMTVASFFTFALYIYELTFPTFLMGWVVAMVQRGAASLQRLDEVLQVEPSIADRPDTLPVQQLAGEIEFRQLTFQYPGSLRGPVLRDVSLHVPAGTSLGIVGAVGSGKTTLAALIPRLYELDDGHVFIDGYDVNRIPLDTLRSSIAVVPQESFLFSMTLADNIAFGLPETRQHEVEAAARRAQLTPDLVELPYGYETLVGERGVMLSGGQRQRTALARALALDPSILILDDTLSSVDSATETAILDELDTVFRGRTVVVIAHRLSAVRHADQIVVMEAGRIVERGSHAELVRAGGIYARMAREQALERELTEGPPDVREGAA